MITKYVVHFDGCSLVEAITGDCLPLEDQFDTLEGAKKYRDGLMLHEPWRFMKISEKHNPIKRVTVADTMRSKKTVCLDFLSKCGELLEDLHNAGMLTKDVFELDEKLIEVKKELVKLGAS